MKGTIMSDMLLGDAYAGAEVHLPATYPIFCALVVAQTRIPAG